jgi:tetratricopeptide (TPR) repeat protein
MNDHSHISETFTLAMTEFLANNYQKCVEHLNEVIQHDPGHEKALLTRGAAYLKLDHASAAIQDFNRVIDSNSGSARAYHLRGLSREQLGESDEALGDFHRAIEIDPDYGAAYYSRAALYSRTGEMDRAADDIAMVTALTNRNIESFANENNVWRSQHLRLESILESDLNR